MLKKKKESKQTPFLLILVTGVHQSTEKIENLNPQNNEKTIEFRFLRGTLKWETFFISLNLLKNIVENSRKSNHVITLEDLIFNGLDDEFKNYAIDYCKKRKITDEECDWKKPLFLEKTNSESLSNIFQFNELDLANDILNDE